MPRSTHRDVGADLPEEDDTPLQTFAHSLQFCLFDACLLRVDAQSSCTVSSDSTLCAFSCSLVFPHSTILTTSSSCMAHGKSPLLNLELLIKLSACCPSGLKSCFTTQMTTQSSSASRIHCASPLTSIPSTMLPDIWSSMSNAFDVLLDSDLGVRESSLIVSGPVIEQMSHAFKNKWAASAISN